MAGFLLVLGVIGAVGAVLIYLLRNTSPLLTEEAQTDRAER